jgi:DNA replication protein DnaC
MNALKTRLKDFKLSGILLSLDERLKYANDKALAYVELLDLLFEDEANSRRDNNLKKRLYKAKFPSDKTIEGFNFASQPSIDKKKINDAFTCQFIEQKENIVFIGTPGTGKTHLSIAIGKNAILKGYKVLFTTVADILNKLHTSKADNSYYKKLEEYTSSDLLILDELGFKTLSSHSASDFFEIITRCYEKRSLIITTNKDFEQWGEIFADKIMATAITDRVQHHVMTFKITGSSYRTRNIKNN